ncbi:hypothetical protein [Pseudonocardia phyllosphaerae]|uniref:hypothetical protein n=1 Tax=Pseudonocardia phyllosphaerae TaxID=3390502 RepID=UPI00397ACC6E
MNALVRRPDGTPARSCFAIGGQATVAVNVYTTNRTTPVRWVRAAPGAHPVGGLRSGVAAAVLETVGGPTLQVGTARRLVTVTVAGRSPDERTWRAVAAALTR